MVEIRNAKTEELPRILEIYEAARRFMRKSGNMQQWQGGFPPKELLREDIKVGQLYVICEEGRIGAVFALILGEDPTYSYIEDGSWLSNTPYGTIHRIATDGSIKDVLKLAADFSWEKIPHLRVDTHADNHPMQNAVLRWGFQRRGIIYIADGTPRIAYEKI